MKKWILILFVAVFSFSSCASTREGRRGRSDRVHSQNSSYRIRGTDYTGKLTSSQRSRLRAKTRGWGWPTYEPTLTSNFGERFGNHHDGVDLRADVGTPVFSVAAGNVIYAGNQIAGYGKMIVIRHNHQMSTVYAHNSKLLVKKGDTVRKGQRISLSGNTGRSTGPHVHFEIREGVTAIDPSLLLPSPDIVRAVNRKLAKTSPSNARKIASESGESRSHRRRYRKIN